MTTTTNSSTVRSDPEQGNSQQPQDTMSAAATEAAVVEPHQPPEPPPTEDGSPFWGFGGGGGSLKAPSPFSLNYNSLKAVVSRSGNPHLDQEEQTPLLHSRHKNPMAVMTYTAGEDASRLALAAKQLGLERQRKTRAPVRRIALSLDHVVSILATSTTAPTPGDTEALEQEAPPQHPRLQWGEAMAGVAGNILEWYDFAVFGYFGDVIGQVFFPPSAGHTATLASFAVFGGAFLARPAGGVVLGYIGDVYGHKVALRTSIFLMAVPTFLLGCLPSFDQVGYWSPLGLIVVRLLQGLSVGGQLLSSLVFTLERSPRHQWGLYGSFVFCTGNLGTLLGGLVGYWIRSHLSPTQLLSYGWRIPFWMGVVVSWSGLYLRGGDGEGGGGHGADAAPPPTTTTTTVVEEEEEGGVTESMRNQTMTHKPSPPRDTDEGQPLAVPQPAAAAANNGTTEKQPTINPLQLVFEPHNLRPLLASATVPMLWSAGFYMTFVWMPIYMTTMADEVVPHAFAVNSLALLVSVILLFPLAGFASDVWGRRPVMTLGAVTVAVLSPTVLFPAIGTSGQFGPALAGQVVLGICLSVWGSPMCAWLVEAFSNQSQARLTSMAIGYNVALAIVGGLTPAMATYLVDAVGPLAPAWIYSSVALVALVGLWVIAPPPPSTTVQGRA